MKEILKKAMIPIFLSVICGCVCGRVVYKIYLGNNKLAFDGNLIYLIESGSYTSYDSMRANTIGYDYVYYEEDNLYKTIVGITKNEDNVEKIKKAYNGEVQISKYYNEDKELNSKINEYDELLLQEENEEKIKKIIVDMIGLYKNEDNIKLIKIS